jgi:biopolymer transport protein ExbD
MRKIRRNNHEARVELMPLIDVIFLLLTFFIYSLMVMVHIDVKNVNFTELDAGVRARAEKIKPVTLLVDQRGELELDKQGITLTELESELRSVMGKQAGAKLFLVIEEGDQDAPVDRLPLYLKVNDAIRAAGIKQVVRVGRAQTSTQPGSGNGTPEGTPGGRGSTDTPD